MRASRLLQILLLLQSRGRMTSATLAQELEVARRTILRDVDALSEAGLPVVVHPGHRGGIELGFDYRTRLPGFSTDEAEAIGVMLARPVDDLAAVGLADAGNRARRKLVESFPDRLRQQAGLAARRFRFAARLTSTDNDPRVPALATAIRESRVVRIETHRPSARTIHPIALVCDGAGWSVEDDLQPGAPISLASCGDINISSRTFLPRAVSAST